MATRLESTVQHRASSAGRRHSAASKGTHSYPVSHALGTYSTLGKRPFHRGNHDQRKVRDSNYEAYVPRSPKVPPLLDSRDGFYEWQKMGQQSNRFCFEVNNGELFAFAALWDGWKDSNGQWIRTCSILTTTPNAVTSAIHDRMPVILSPDSYDLWLDPKMHDVDAISEFLKPYDARQMRCYPVSARINRLVNDEECSRPIEITEVQNRLFA